jgi:hypothetical protein
MCGCCRSAHAEKPAALLSRPICQRLFDLFQSDVLVVVVDAGGQWLFRRGSTPAIEAEFANREGPFGQAVVRGEAAVRRTMDSCRAGTNLLSFRLNCLSGRTIVVVLSDNHRLVVVNRGEPTDSPTFDDAFRQICDQIRASLQGADAPAQPGPRRPTRPHPSSK